ncbi:SGNH/GDSL hydrolase family protein [Terriglobus saanensis]|uniref:Lipolytic protein G-D-S-L family n=1 Tax=Terriglobus saanensis (strain ATCC BAA-1853 / DSM 23119 / SP1PR4) TaxID=401053 RepID=E8V0L4_TERSS|nr:SGNH/GDSL hydrolase family protein [Terriglobus saanensis]ADV81077.1 lipolytic protein G-D-S-L family [Terriglobus saanensis SP1PR4]
MRRIDFALLAATTLLPSALAGQASPAPMPASPSLKVDATLVTPVTELTTAQITAMQKKLADWPQLERYRAANAALPAPAPGEQRVVFYGDSITDAWAGPKNSATFFPGKNYIGRGISGQTTPQMLVRFQQDVVALHPAAVVVLAGTNDLAGNTGLSTQEMIEDNIRSMADIARANGIRFVLASLLPVSDYKWRPGLQPAAKVRAVNLWMKQFAAERGLVYVDYYSALANAEGGMREGTSNDGVHPTGMGYTVMMPIAQEGIDKALKGKP